MAVKVLFTTSVGDLDVLLDERSGIVSIYRLGPDGRPVAAAIDGLAYTELDRLLIFEIGLPPTEAEEVASVLMAKWESPDEEATPPRASARRPWRSMALRAAFAGVMAVSAWTIAQAIF
jgi:hypothetical protein